MRPPFRLASLVCVCALVAAGRARADILATPFLGKTFAAETTFRPADPGTANRKWIFGASAAWLGDGVLGAEVDLGYAPRFFDSGLDLTKPGSNVTTLTGNVILAVPLTVTRESLRPYVVAGLGVMHAGADDLVSNAPVDRNLMAIALGGGAIGFLTPRTGLRFDLRQIRSTSSGVDTATGARQAQLGFWRATVGVVIRY